MKTTYIYPFVALLMTACVEDEGNYTYKDLNEVNIENIESSYAAISGFDRIQISPSISDTFGKDPKDFEYEWHICGESHNHVSIGNEKDLDWVVNLPAGNYSLYLVVKDKSTGIETQALTTIRVASTLTRGFLLYGDLPEENQIGLDILSMPVGLDTVMVENVFDNSKLKLQKANKIIYSGEGYTSFNQALWLLADDKAYRLTSGTEFKSLGEFNDRKIINVNNEHETPMRMVDMYPHQTHMSMCRNYRGYLLNDMIFLKNIISYEDFTQPVNRYSSIDTKLFKPFPFVWYQPQSYAAYQTTIYFDVDSQCFCFLGNPLYNQFCTKLTDKYDPWSWTITKDNRTLICGDNPVSTLNFSYAILKDADDNYVVYRFKPVANAYTSAQKSLININKSIATDFDKASIYKFAPNRTSVIYTVGSKIYHYDYNRGMIGVKDLGDEITHIEQDISRNGVYDEFFVATYGDENKGKVYKFKVDNTPGIINLDFIEGQEWPTRLKVVDIEWKYGGNVD